MWLRGEVTARSLGSRAASLDEQWCAGLEEWTRRITERWTGIETFVAPFEPGPVTDVTMFGCPSCRFDTPAEAGTMACFRS